MTCGGSIGHMTDDVTSRSWPRYTKCPLSRKWLDI